MIIVTFSCFHNSLWFRVLLHGFYIELALTHLLTGHAGFDTREGSYPTLLATRRRAVELGAEPEFGHGLELIGKNPRNLLYGRQARLETGEGFNA